MRQNLYFLPVKQVNWAPFSSSCAKALEHAISSGAASGRGAGGWDSCVQGSAAGTVAAADAAAADAAAAAAAVGIAAEAGTC